MFRNLHGHKSTEGKGIVTKFKDSNKILLIPAGTCEGLIDDKFVEEFKNIIGSDSKQNIVVITKLDKTSSYEEYKQNNYEGFIECLKEQIVTTHNSLIAKLQEIEKSKVRQAHKCDKSKMIRKFIQSFDNAYLSKITKDKQENYDAELHKIVCKNKSSKEISTSDIEDIFIFNNWHSIILGVLEMENRGSYDWVI